MLSPFIFQKKAKLCFTDLPHPSSLLLTITYVIRTGRQVRDMEAYEQVQKGPLKLKGVAELGVTKRKKKKKDKDKAKMLEAMGTSKKNEEEKRRCLDKRTPAQAAFEKMQEKRQMERILKKASKTHKQRVEDFNRHLDTLTEHYDIPKVSWTK